MYGESIRMRNKVIRVMHYACILQVFFGAVLLFHAQKLTYFGTRFKSRKHNALRVQLLRISLECVHNVFSCMRFHWRLSAIRKLIGYWKHFKIDFHFNICIVPVKECVEYVDCCTLFYNFD